jgi:non-ribosomal peptide synthetase component F
VTACVHEQFISAAQKWPHAPAINAWDGNFSYHELDRFFSRLANCLISRGVNREEVVGICYEKFKWTIVCMLATMKAGGICLFLDPNAPRIRRESMLHKANAKLLLTSPVSIEEAGYQIPNMMILDHIFDRLEPLSPTCSQVASSPSDAAFVFFSSGGTGIPKASVVEYRSVCTLARNRGELISHGMGIRLFQYTSYTFGLAHCDILTILLQGGCLCISSDQDLMNYLAQAICCFDANLTYLTPSVFEMITPDSVPRLENLIVGGEPLSTKFIQTWTERTGLVVTYGPSECIVSSVGMGTMGFLGSDTQAGIIGYGMGARTWDDDVNRLKCAVQSIYTRSGIMRIRLVQDQGAGQLQVIYGGDLHWYYYENYDSQLRDTQRM